jgi:hypothetical protein
MNQFIECGSKVIEKASRKTGEQFRFCKWAKQCAFNKRRQYAIG